MIEINDSYGICCKDGSSKTITGNKMKSEKCWAIWKKDTHHGPTRLYTSKGEAVVAANNLASKENESYYILEIIGKVSPISVAIEYKDIK